MNRSLINLLDKQARLPIKEQNPLFSVFAFPLSILMRVIVSARNFFYDRQWRKSEHLPGMVISVGNIVAGGVGKTPFISFLARRLLREGCSPAVLHRGYGSGLQPGRRVVFLNGDIVFDSIGDDSPCFADEARMLSVQLQDVPVIVSSDRLDGVKFWQELGAVKITHWLLDDGFQHRKIFRDVDIVLMSIHAPLGNGWLMPLGILRETWKSLRRAHAVVMINEGSDSDASLSNLKTTSGQFFLPPNIPTVVASPIFLEPVQVAGPSLPVGLSPELRIVAATGIARPGRFHRALRQKNYVPVEMILYADHERFAMRDFANVTSIADACIVTEKDYWREPMFFTNLPIPTYVLPMELHLSDSDNLEFVFSK